MIISKSLWNRCHPLTISIRIPNQKHPFVDERLRVRLPNVRLSSSLGTRTATYNERFVSTTAFLKTCVGTYGTRLMIPIFSVIFYPGTEFRSCGYSIAMGLFPKLTRRIHKYFPMVGMQTCSDNDDNVFPRVIPHRAWTFVLALPLAVRRGLYCKGTGGAAGDRGPVASTALSPPTTRVKSQYDVNKERAVNHVPNKYILYCIYTVQIYASARAREELMNLPGDSARPVTAWAWIAFIAARHSYYYKLRRRRPVKADCNQRTSRASQ